MNKIEKENHIEKLSNSAERLIEKKQKQSPKTGQVDAIVIGTDKELPKAGEKVLAKITIPSKTMGHFYEVVYHNGESWLPQKVFQYGNKIIDFKAVEECL